MKRYYSHYTKWEDYKNAMYKKDCHNIKITIKDCRELLINTIMFKKIMIKILREWPESVMVNLTNPSRNRQAWLGQASCCYAFKAPEFVTKLAWRTLTNKQKQIANYEADKTIKLFERLYNGSYFKFNELMEYERTLKIINGKQTMVTQW